MRTLILTPTRKETCGMYQLAKDEAKKLNGDIVTLRFANPLYRLFPILDFIWLKGYEFNLKKYDTIITFIYPMHLWGREARGLGKKWIIYDNLVPEPKFFRNFWRRQYIKIFRRLDEWSKKNPDEYWSVKDRWQKPRYTEKKDYALYLGRKEDYKNFYWLRTTLRELKIPFEHPENQPDDLIHA